MPTIIPEIWKVSRVKISAGKKVMTTCIFPAYPPSSSIVLIEMEIYQEHLTNIIPRYVLVESGMKYVKNKIPRNVLYTYKKYRKTFTRIVY